MILTAGLGSVGATVLSAQLPTESWPHAAALERAHPGTYELLLRLERAQGVLLGRIAAEGDAARARPQGTVTPGFESEVVDRLTAVMSGDGTGEEIAEESAAGYAVLGERGARILERGHAFRRETLDILADPDLDDRRAALAEAVRRYRARPEAALPSEPKDMDVVYDHPRAFAFRTRYPDLDGFAWAGLWLTLAVTEPLTDFGEHRERATGLDVVASRYHGKLSRGEPPLSFPSQIPLAPAIAPGFIYMSPEAAMIWDNLSLLQEVLSDVLVSPDVTDVDAALEAAIDFFLNPDLRVTDRAEWESMALQHGIFFQGGYPLAVMTKSELNGDGHAAHIRDGGAPTPMPVIPN